MSETEAATEIALFIKDWREKQMLYRDEIKQISICCAVNISTSGTPWNRRIRTIQPRMSVYTRVVTSKT